MTWHRRFPMVTDQHCVDLGMALRGCAMGLGREQQTPRNRVQGRRQG